MAEKKSTKGKQNTPQEQSKSSADKNKAITPPQSTGDRESNINLGGFKLSPTTVTVVITALLFMIGWSYVSNWYAYFGISADEINISLQQILIFSATPLIYIAAYVGLAGSVYFFYKKIILKTKLDSITSDDWFRILSVSIGLLLIPIYLIWKDLNITYDQYPNEISYLRIIGLVSVTLILVLFGDEFMARSSVRMKWSLITLLLFVVLLSLSATLAFQDAEKGKRGVGGHIQNVFLVSTKPLNAMQSFEISCNDGCSYGPFGLVAEKEGAFYFVIWRIDAKNRVSLNPGIYIVPRSDQNGPYFIIPALTSTVTPVITITPTPAIVVTPTSSQP